MLRRSREERLGQAAGGLTVTTVMSMVPLLALSFAPFVLWNAIRTGLGLRVSWQRLQKMMAELTLRMEENLQGVRVVRAFNARLFEMSRFDEISERALKLSNNRITLRMRSMSELSPALLFGTASASRTLARASLNRWARMIW